VVHILESTGCSSYRGTGWYKKYNNTITIDRPDHANGNCIGAVSGFNKNVKIYKNTLDKTYVPGSTRWDLQLNCGAAKVV